MKVLRNILIVLLVLVALAAGVFAAYWLSDGFGGKVPTMSVEYDGEVHYGNFEARVIAASSEEFTIKPFFGKEYSYRIVAKDSAAGDWSLKIAGETWKWSQLKSRDFTSGFEVVKSDTGIKLVYGSLIDVLKKVFGDDAVDVEGHIPEDIFELDIVAGKREIKIGLYFGAEIEDVTVDPPEVYF